MEPGEAEDHWLLLNRVVGLGEKKNWEGKAQLIIQFGRKSFERKRMNTYVAKTCPLQYISTKASKSGSMFNLRNL